MWRALPSRCCWASTSPPTPTRRPPRPHPPRRPVAAWTARSTARRPAHRPPSDRLRDVEKREDRLERRHEREQERAAERQRVLDEPNALDKLGAKAREDLRARRYDEKRADDADVRAERRAVEAEAEKADRERRDVERAAERVAERAERDAERAARAERDAERAERERRHPPRRKEEGEPGELSDGEAEPEREAAKPRADGGDGGERASSPPHAAAASESEGEGGADDDIMGQLAQEVHARRTAGGTTHDIAPGEDGEAPPPMLTGAQPIRLGLGGSRKRQTPAAFATGAEGEDKQKRKLEKLEYTEAEEAAVAQAPSKQREKAAAEKEKLAKIERARTLVARIPVEQEALFAFEIDWGALERKGVLEAKLRPWISKKLQEYVGDEDVSDEAQAFCAKLWRMLAFEALSAGS
ncbi:hypothetical protein T492DRAFT_389796 [Pavlovales sp. CCMP2436]|nr:hypothetical protein T492DRAFT_389796 [Pavlovales sp. CCMP2436]